MSFFFLVISFFLPSWCVLTWMLQLLLQLLLLLFSLILPLLLLHTD